MHHLEFLFDYKLWNVKEYKQQNSSWQRTFVSFCGLSKFLRVQSHSVSFFMRVYPCITKNIVVIFIWYERTAIYQVNFNDEYSFQVLFSSNDSRISTTVLVYVEFFLKPGLFVQEKNTNPVAAARKISKACSVFSWPSHPHK